MKTSLAAALALVCVLPALAAAGNLDAPGAPASGSGMPTTADIYNRLNSGAAISVPGAFQEPAAGPTAGTGRTLAEIGGRLPAPDNVNGATASEVASGKTFWSLRTDGTWGLTSGAIITGASVTGANGLLSFPIPNALYTGGKTATAADSNLVSGNIKSGVSIFGVSGSLVAAAANVAPVANAGTAQNVSAGATVTLNGSASSDADGDALTYKWSLIYKPSGSSAALNSTTTPTPTFTADVDGGYVFALVVNDGKVDSTVANVATIAVAVAGDIFPPGTTAAPSVSGTTDTATTLSVTIHENGTGYYLVRPASATAPTVAEVQAGTPFAMAANVPATPAISGLIFNTPYTIYFVAKDAANNVQTAVQSVAVTTLLTTGYVVQGGLTWMPVTLYSSWDNAKNYCTYTTINGVTGWRMPTQAELSALYTSGAMNGKGWTLYYTWSSTPYVAYYHYLVYLDTGLVEWSFNDIGVYISCVH